MAADREMARNAIVAQIADQCSELWQVELEDQREADDQRIARLRLREDIRRIALEVEDGHCIAVLAQRGRQIAEPKVLLINKADQNDRARGVARAPRQRSKI